MPEYSVRTGSTRTIIGTSSGVVMFDYTNAWSVFDKGPSPQHITTYGACRTAVAVANFVELEGRGIRTHFVGQVSETAMHVLEVEIPGVRSITGKTHGRHTCLEWIVRSNLDGSLWRRFVEGTVSKQDLGLHADAIVSKGMRLPKLWHDSTTKFEAEDRVVDVDEAQRISGLTTSQFTECQGFAGECYRIIHGDFEKIGKLVPDFKCEIAWCVDGDGPMLIDVISLDEMRIIDMVTGELQSKDLIRVDPQIAKWNEQLLKPAKKRYPLDKTMWPDYPVLPQEKILGFAKTFQAVTLDCSGTCIE